MDISDLLDTRTIGRKRGSKIANKLAKTLYLTSVTTSVNQWLTEGALRMRGMLNLMNTTNIGYNNQIVCMHLIHKTYALRSTCSKNF